MFYYLYQITNLINGKIYVGVHKTNDLNDGYMGSGKIIRSAIAKHGISNFSKVILEQFDNSIDMYAREKEVVTEEFIARKDVYNLRRGGTGGFDYINKNRLNGFSNKEVALRGRVLANQILEIRFGKNWRSVISKKGSMAAASKESKKKTKLTKIKNGTYGDTSAMNSPIALIKKKEKFKEIKHQQGEKNSNFGKMWITDGITSVMTKKSDQIPYGWKKGRV